MFESKSLKNSVEANTRRIKIIHSFLHGNEGDLTLADSAEGDYRLYENVNSRIDAINSSISDIRKSVGATHATMKQDKEELIKKINNIHIPNVNRLATIQMVEQVDDNVKALKDTLVGMMRGLALKVEALEHDKALKKKRIKASDAIEIPTVD